MASGDSATVSTTNYQTLEQKLTRLQEIQQILAQKVVSLSESMPLLEEAFRLKKEIEKELESMQNKLVRLAKVDEDTEI